ncbi:MAG: PD-(D/E)XK nuclease family protein [Euryarchaeota archaeon]|nr:PD-(D/E)XK nuclease family protein [Euryarchaeota archaeon]
MGGVDIERVKPMLDVFWGRGRDRIRSNLMLEQKFTVPLHLFKGFIDRVDMIPGTGNDVEIIDYKTGGEPGPDERSRQLLLYAHGFKHLHPGYTVRRLSLELLLKPKPRVCELDDAGYVSSRVAPLDAGLLLGRADVAECIIHDHRHGLARVDDGAVPGLWVSVVLWVNVREGFCCSGRRSVTPGSNIRKTWSCGTTPCQLDCHIKQNIWHPTTLVWAIKSETVRF